MGSVNKLLFVCVVVSALPACFQGYAYQQMQSHEKNECYKLPGSEMDKCLDRVEKSYEEYKKSREELGE